MANGKRRKQKKPKKPRRQKGLRFSKNPITARPSSGRRGSKNKKRGIARRKKNKTEAKLEKLGIDLPSNFDLLSVALKSPELSPGQLTDELAMRFGARERLQRTLAQEWLIRQGSTIRVWKRGFVLISSGSPVAVVCPTHASISEQGRIRAIDGAFTKTGAHWDQLWVSLGISEGNEAVSLDSGHDQDHEEEHGLEDRDLIDATSGDQEDGSSQRDLILDLEDRVDAASFASALLSTRRLREERSVALPVPALIEADGFTIRFEPIVSDSGAPAVPFEYRNEAGLIQGEIYLASPETPLAVAVFNGEEALRGPAIVVLLAAYVDLTCLEVDGHVDKGEDQQPAEAEGRSRQRSDSGRCQEVDLRSQRVRPAPSRKSSAIWGQSLRIVGRNPLERSSIVVGHIRRLGPGREASAEAARRAREVGITLREGETWVSPHIRGQAEIGELRFEWKRDSTG